MIGRASSHAWPAEVSARLAGPAAALLDAQSEALRGLSQAMADHRDPPRPDLQSGFAAFREAFAALEKEVPPDALSFELLRTVNSAQVRGTQVAGNGPVLTLRRAIALLGVDGVRNTANALRQWPGPMDEAAAAAMARLINVVRLAGHAAQALRPPGYDAEVVFLVAVMQNLGRLLVQYHFPDEAEQIRQLMQPLPPKEPEAPPQPGLSEESAAYAVLGVDIESLGAAVARHWGLGDEVQHMIRRLPAGKPVRHPDSDADMLRAAASAANEAVDAMTRLPAPKIAAAIAQVSQRYARVLELSPRELQEALQGARAALQSGTAAAAMPRTITSAGEATATGPA